MKNNNTIITGFVHWKDGEITETEKYRNIDEAVEKFEKTYMPMIEQINGVEFFNHKTYEIISKFY